MTNDPLPAALYEVPTRLTSDDPRLRSAYDLGRLEVVTRSLLDLIDRSLLASLAMDQWTVEQARILLAEIGAR